MDPLTRLLMQGAAGAGGAGLGIEEIFSTWLYTGNSSTQTITNGIDLSGEGGLVWLKNRSLSASHALIDTELGGNQHLRSNDPAGSGSSYSITFNSNGFGIGSSAQDVNESTRNYASWTFRKAPGFFDVVTYTGNGSVQTVSHNLGSVPGTIIIKCTTAANSWGVYHRSTGNTQILQLNKTDAAASGSIFWNNTTPTSSVFTVGSSALVNDSGQTYVAYLFAHDEQVFGEGSDQSVIKCGGYTGTGAAGNEQTLGWEPQWLLIKRSDSTEDWQLVDSMRGMPTSGALKLFPNLSNGDVGPSVFANATATGFIFNTGSSTCNALAGTYVYIAIRRGPMKTPTSATEVFLPSTTARNTEYTVGFPPDLAISKTRLTADPTWVGDRLRGNYPTLKTESTDAEQTGFLSWTFDATTGRWKDILSNDPIQYLFRRAPGFFDMVAYTGTGSARTVNHNLGVAPELMITKQRNAVRAWAIGVPALGTGYMFLDDSIYTTPDTSLYTGAPTSTGVPVSGSNFVNGTSNTYIMYLFASSPGVSKVGTYTGTASTLNVNCGFTAGARFVLIKRTDNGGASRDWYVWDTARGISSGNDPYLLLNSSAAEVTSTDYINPLNSGFQISSTAPAAINASGGTYIFLAIA